VRKTILVGLLATAVLALTASQAWATSCSPVNKPAGAGANAGTLTVTFTSPDAPPTVVADFNTNPAGHVTGGFLSVTVIVGGEVVDTANTFKNDLPDGAHNSGPGDSECDGVGIDDLATCP
jgi:hypothetical protein